jgi:hypothetical protein
MATPVKVIYISHVRCNTTIAFFTIRDQFSSLMSKIIRRLFYCSMFETLVQVRHGGLAELGSHHQFLGPLHPSDILQAPYSDGADFCFDINSQ